MQASVNSRIRQDLRSPYITSMVSFIFGILIMLLVILAAERNMYIPIETIAGQPFWIWLGGACGTSIIVLNIVCLPKLGSARNVMFICFGQTMAGLAIDQFGLFGSQQISLSPIRAAGGALVLLGIALINDFRKSGKSGSRNAEIALFSLLSISCGCACAIQIAVNGTLNHYAGSGFKATFISMVVGLVTTLLLITVIVLVKGRYSIYDGGKDHGPVRYRFWMPAGGALAVVIVMGNAIAAPVIGTGADAILNLVGMMGASLIIDATGFLGIEKQPVNAVKVAGMLSMIAGSALISLL